MERTKERHLDLEAKNDRLAKLCARPSQTDAKDKAHRLTEAHIAEISNLLEDIIRKKEFSSRPRTYAVLRMINCHHAMNAFISEGLTDGSFPYTRHRLPRILDFEEAKEFLLCQRYVYSDVLDIEKGVHVTLADGDVCFDKGRTLGVESQGTTRVDKVTSKITSKVYARKRISRKKMFGVDRKALKTFENELSALKALGRHNHLVKVKGSYTDKKWLALLLSPVADGNLKEYLRSGGPWPRSEEREFRTYFGCLANTIAYLHSSKIRHKDIKPENILLKNRRLYLTDFGTAFDWSTSGQSMTLGNGGDPRTPRYQSPEVAQGQECRSSSDIWSLGVVFLEMETLLRGKTLGEMDKFLAKNGTKMPAIHANIAGALLWFEPLQAGESGPRTDNEPLAWIKTMLNRVPSNRPSASDLSDQILDFQNGEFCGHCCRDDDDSTSAEFQSGMSEDQDDTVCARQLTTVHEGKSKATGGVSEIEPPQDFLVSASTPNTNQELGVPNGLDLPVVSSAGSEDQITSGKRVLPMLARLAANIFGKGVGALHSSFPGPDPGETLQSSTQDVTCVVAQETAQVHPTNILDQKVGTLPGSFPITDAEKPFQYPAQDMASLDVKEEETANSSCSEYETPDQTEVISRFGPPSINALDQELDSEKLLRSPVQDKDGPGVQHESSRFSGTIPKTVSKEIGSKRHNGTAKVTLSMNTSPPSGGPGYTFNEERVDSFLASLPEGFSNHPFDGLPSDQHLHELGCISTAPGGSPLVIRRVLSFGRAQTLPELKTMRGNDEKHVKDTSRLVHYASEGNLAIGCETSQEILASTLKDLKDFAAVPLPLPSASAEEPLQRQCSQDNVPSPQKEKAQGEAHLDSPAATTPTASTNSEGNQPITLTSSVSARPSPLLEELTGSEGKADITSGKPPKKQVVITLPLTAGALEALPDTSAASSNRQYESASVYMKRVLDGAASVAPTSVMSANTRAKLGVPPVLLRYNDSFYGWLPAFVAGAKTGAVRHLLSSGCNPGTKAKPRPVPIFEAVRGQSPKHTKCLRMLIEYGADPNAVNSRQRTPLHYAIEHEDWEGYSTIVYILLKAHADSNKEDGAGDVPLLMLLIGNGPLPKNRRDALYLLLAPEFNTNLNVRVAGTQETPLHLAVRRKDPWAVDVILHSISQTPALKWAGLLHRRNSSGFTALVLAFHIMAFNASAADEEQIVRLLLKNGADPNDQDESDGSAPLHILLRKGHRSSAIIKMLCNAGANPRLLDKEMQSALDVCRESRQRFPNISQWYDWVETKLLQQD